MEHIYKEHSDRNITSLNGEWKFCIDEKQVGEREEWFKQFPTEYRYINVPGCWNLELDLYGYFGTAWYSREFETGDCFLQMTFGAVTGLTKVYLDGEFLGEHYGGWSLFEFEKQVGAGVHTLTVSVDASSNGVNTIPLQVVDWYHYGGITRSVEITEYQKPFIKNQKISYVLDERLEQAVMAVEFELANPFGIAYETEVEIALDGVRVAAQKVISLDNVKLRISDINVENIRLWDAGKGELYEVRIATKDDDVFERIGFRKIEVRDCQIFLNNKPIFLKGVNRHEHHPDWGFALPANLMKRDLQIIKDLNCNTVRGSHYPNSQTFLDYLDREGILFWSEIPMWGFPKEALGDGLTQERSMRMHEEMIAQYFHHPSVVIWGLHNEVATDSEEGYNLTKRMYELVRELDDSRLVTYASNRFDRELCLEFCDFVSLNYYHGWYGDKISDWDAFVHGLRGTMIEKGVGEKPIVMSEFGCGAIYGYSSFNHDKWTMQYQSDFVERVIQLCAEEEGVCGAYVWQFADMNSDKDVSRCRSFNNKGILDEYRRPKMSYDTVRTLYGKIN